MASSSFSFFSPRNLVVFLSFSREDVPKNFLNRIHRKLRQEMILTYESQSIGNKLGHVIRDSRIAVIVLSKCYVSSSWCLNELLEILQCKEDLGQLVIPIFYGFDPSHLKSQSGEFGEAFKNTCQNQTEEVKIQWKQALIDVANIFGYDSKHWDNDEKMIDEIVNDVLNLMKLTSSKDIEHFVDVKLETVDMISWLDLDTQEVLISGIWGPSGIGKSTRARSLFRILVPRFQISIFIDKGFVSKTMEIYTRLNPDDYKGKLRLQKAFLSEILGKKHQKVLLFIDDLDNQLVVDAVAGQTQWFGSGSRIIVVTNDKHLLMAYGVDGIYEVCLPSEKLALILFCRYVFGRNSPPDGFWKLASKVVSCAGSLPLALNAFGSYLRGKDKEGWIDMMPKLQNGLDEDNEKTLRVNYNGLNNKRDEAIFRYIACLFSGENVSDIKMLLADSDLDFNIGLSNLVDKALVHVREDTVVMHRLLQEMGKKIVCEQSNEPGKREFLVDPKDIRDVLEDNVGADKVLGIALDIDESETDDLRIHESAFKGMPSLLFLKFNTKLKKEVRWHLPKEFDYLPPTLRLLSWENYPLSCLPCKFGPENLVKLEMQGSKLETLWKGVRPLKGLKVMDLSGSGNLKEIPDLSMAINLEILRLNECVSLVELPASIEFLNQLMTLEMRFCNNLEILPTGINLQSLDRLDLRGCSRLRSFPDISTNISFLDLGQTAIEVFPSKLRLENLADLFMDEMMSNNNLWEGVQPLTPLMTMMCPLLMSLWLSDIPSLVELPSSFRNLNQLVALRIENCKNLETLPSEINLEHLNILNLTGCSQLRSFPDISTNVSELYLSQTAIEEVPGWIEKFSCLSCLIMRQCKNLQCVSINVSKLKHLRRVDFSYCEELTEASWSGSPCEVTVETDCNSPVSDEDSSCGDFAKVEVNLVNCFNLDQEVLYQKQAVFFKSMKLSGAEVPSYFTHRAAGTSLANIPLPHISSTRPLFRFKACVVVNSVPISIGYHSSEIEVCCLFVDRPGNQFDLADSPLYFSTTVLGCHLVIFDCCFPLNEDNAHLAESTYYQVSIKFRLMSGLSHLNIKECGIRLLDSEEFGDRNDVGISNWLYDLFPSFSGGDIRENFLSHFLKVLDLKMISAFKDNEIERGQSLGPKLKQAIRDSRIAVVIFSKNYASSSWCLNELLEIVRCKEELSQSVIPIFYCMDPSHVRRQTGDFGKIFENTCKNKTEDEIQAWRQALTDIANITGYHSQNWNSEATMVEAITNDLLGQLNLSPSKDFENFVGIEYHMTEMSKLLQLESKEVRMVGIWGSSGVGKTTIARALFNRVSRLFQSSVFIDRAFLSKSMEIYSKANPDDYNMKLHLQENFLSEILGKRDIKIEHLGALGEKLKHRKVLIFIDDLEDRVVLNALVGQTHWFGRGSRIIMVTKDKHLLRDHKIDCIYEVGLPNEDLSLQMLCRYAFKKDSPPDSLMKLASEVALCAGNLPLALNVLGLSLWGRGEKDWMDMLSRLQNGLDGDIEKTLRVSYDGLKNKKDKAIFRHIACLFNGEEINDIQVLLADSSLDVNIGLKNLVDKSLIHERCNTVEMHCLLQEMGKEIVCEQSNEPGEREFLVDSKDVCNVLEHNTGTKKILGVSLDIDEIDELNIHERAFEMLHNLRFLKLYTKNWMLREEERLHLREDFNYFAPKLRLLCWDRYPMSYMPSSFRTENLVKLQMRCSKLEKLWEGVCPLKGLKVMDLRRSENLKEIPDLSMAINLEILRLNECVSLVELPSSIKYLNQLMTLDMPFCDNLEILPTGINLKSLDRLDFRGCSRLKSFPDISSNISYFDISQTAIEEIPSTLRLENLVELVMEEMKNAKPWEGVQPLTPLLSPSLKMLWLSEIPGLVELPCSFQNLKELENLGITNCINLETVTSGINLKSLHSINFKGCSRLRSFPNISTNISLINLERTAIEEVPWWIERFFHLSGLHMSGCNSLQKVSLNIYKLRHLGTVDFSFCGALTEASWSGSPCEVGMENGDEASSSLSDNYVPKVQLNLFKCFNLDQEALLRQQPVFYKAVLLEGYEVPSYFTHHTSESSLIVPLIHTSPSQEFFKFKACAVVYSRANSLYSIPFEIHVNCWFIDRHDNYFASGYWPLSITTTRMGYHLVIFECRFPRFPLKEDNAPLVEVDYDYVDIQINLTSDNSLVDLTRYGVRLHEDSSSPEDYPLPHVCDGNERCSVTLAGYESKHKEECEAMPLTTMLFPFLTLLKLSHIPSLVEVPSSFQNLNTLKKLRIRCCVNLETLPNGINLKSLDLLDLNGCSRLSVFPDISTNISQLFLRKTGIEEVSWWIENLSHLKSLKMRKCNQLESISPRIFKLNHIEEVSFSDCEQLTQVRWPEEAQDISNPRTNLSLIVFTNCFRLNQEAFIQQSASEYLILPGVRVPPYFTHRSIRSYLTVPLDRSSLSQQSFLAFKACVVVSQEDVDDHQLCLRDCQVHCHFRDKHGNYLDPAKPRHFSLHKKYNHLIMFDCHFPLNQDCDQVEIEFRLASIQLILKECGLRLLETPFPATHNEVDDEGYETALDEEDCEDNNSDHGSYETAIDGDCGDSNSSDDDLEVNVAMMT